MKKRIATSLMAAAMMTGTLASAATASAEELVTVSLYIPTLATYTEEAIAQVETAMNEILAADYGINVDLQYIEFGNFEKNVNLAMTTDEVDVTCYFNLTNLVNNGQLLDITEYFNNASEELKNTFTAEELTATTIDGTMYGLVRKYQYGAKNVVVMNADMVAELGIDPATVTDMESLGEVLYQAKEKYPDAYALVPQTGAEMAWAKSWDEGIGNTTFLFAEDADSTELKSVFELDALAEFCSYTNQWYQDGLIMSDALSNTMEGTNLVSAGTAFACMHNADIDPLDTLYENTVVSADLVAPRAIATDIGNLKYGISANSAHPDEAFKLLEAIYTDEEVVTLLLYGIEGEHYVINENGRADYPEGMDSTTEPYGGFVATAVYPNYLLAPAKASSAIEDYKAAVDEWNAGVNVTDTYGFFFDTSEYTDFVTAYTNIKEKYLNAILTGSVALDDVLPAIQSELESIGFYEILAEAQTELDAYLTQ